MKLSDYQWSHNPRGMHNRNAAAPFSVDRLVQMKMGLAKIVAIDREFMNVIQPMIASNITPIVRVWRPHYGAGAFTPDMEYAWRQYYSYGVRWFEYYNEPNLDIEWPNMTPPDYNNATDVIAPLMTNWMSFAEKIIEIGAYPAFPALSETVGNRQDVTSWLLVIMQWLADNAYDRFRNIANNGMWVATHPYFYNHFFQEGSSVLSPRQPGEERAEDGGWHFEYPYDPVTQADKPGLTAISGGPDTPQGDPIGLTGMGHAFMQKFGELFGGGSVPVIGTEGGITPVPAGINDSRQLDSRFPAFTWNSHGEATVATFNWIAEQAPPWMFGLTLWKDDDYFEGPSGPLPATKRLAETAPLYKTVPPVDALGGPGPHVVKIPVGPGPIHATPDYHWLIIAPGFNAEWFFDEGHDYYDRFRPTIVTSLDFIAYIPYAKSLAVTVLTTAELAGYMTQQVREQWPTVYFDLVVAEDQAGVATVLRARAAKGLRFG